MWEPFMVQSSWISDHVCCIPSTTGQRLKTKWFSLWFNLLFWFDLSNPVNGKVPVIVLFCSLSLSLIKYHSNSCQYWSRRHPPGRSGHHGDRTDLCRTPDRWYHTHYCSWLVPVSSSHCLLAKILSHIKGHQWIYCQPVTHFHLLPGVSLHIFPFVLNISAMSFNIET